jgi:ubiquinone/menaquinone biosynthesis C-methylase UbiE
VILLDLSERMLRHCPHRSPSRVCASLLELPFPDAVFDIVVAAWVVETTSDPRRVLDECLRVLRPGGVLLYAYAAAPVARWALLASVPVRSVVRRSFAGAFLGPGLRPDVAHELLHRHRGRRQLAVQATVRKPWSPR